MVNESKIRDFLSDNLNIIENGLELIDTEYHISNSYGASGRIDILARDIYGHYIIIEIKRSNQTARQALHEIHKYVGLLRLKFKLPSDKIRCIIVSTHWDELLVPFSEFTRNFDYPSEGYKIKINNYGKILKIELVNPLGQNETRKLCPEHIIYLCPKNDNIDKGVQVAQSILKKLGVKHFCILEIEYSGDSPYIIYPYGIYLVLEVFSESLKNKFIKKYQIDSDELQESPWLTETSVISELGGKLNIFDTAEIGYPEKFSELLKSWIIKRIHRYGRLYDAKQLIPDKELINQIAGYDGQNAFIFYAFANPKYKPNWNQVIKDSQYCLMGNKLWIKAFNWFSTFILKKHRDSNISLHIFNPMNILLSIYKVALENDFSYLPQMDLVTVDSKNEDMAIMRSFINWNGKSVNISAEEIIEKYFGEPFDFFLSSKMMQTMEYDLNIMSDIGLKYEFMLIEQNEINAIPHQIYFDSNGVDLIRKYESISSNIHEYFKRNVEFMSSLISLIKSNMTEIK